MERVREKEMIPTDCISVVDNLPNSKLKLYDILGGMVCQNCGYEADWRALEIDHLFGKEKGYEPIRNLAYWLENPDQATEELQVLCANCHRIKTWEDRKGW